MNNRAIISDILLWIVLALVVGAGVFGVRAQLAQRQGETVVIHFRDANEITRGSLVRMMGTEIGYVDNIKLRKDNVAVTIRTYPEALEIPSGSLFTVQFTGLVGAKSIEIVPPRVPRPNVHGKPLYRVEEPIRLKDNMNYQMDILQDLQVGAENITDFFGKKKPVEELQVNIQQARAWVNQSNRFFEQSRTDLRQIRSEMTVATSEAVDTLEKFNRGMQTARAATDPARLRGNVNGALNHMADLNRLLTTEGNAIAGTVGLQGQMAGVNATHGEVSRWISRTHQAVSGRNWLEKLDRFSGQGNQVVEFLDRCEAGISAENTCAALYEARCAMQGFNGTLTRYLDSLNRKIEAEEARRNKR